MPERVIVVLGATSRIGDVVVRALSNDFSVRAITRDPSSAAASRLEKIPNVQVTKGDITCPTDLSDILSGAWGVFVHFHVDFDDAQILLSATKMGHGLVQACERAGVQHVVYHTALSPLQSLGISAKHWDAKAQVEVLFRESGLNVTYLMVALPFDCFLDILKPEKLSKDHYRIAFPIGTTPVDFMGLEDAAVVVRRVFSEPQNFRSKTVALTAGKMTTKDICDSLSFYFSPIRFTDRQITHQEFRELPFPGSRDWSNATEFLVRTDQKYSRELTQRLNPATRSFAKWIADNEEKIREVL